MAAFIVLVIFVTVVAAGFAARRWLGGRLSFPKVHSKKQDEDGVEIVVQKPAHERRLKLSLPDISYVQIRSPVGPMKSSIRSALKELRSRQMVQSLCSRFETRMKVACDPDESAKEAPNKPTLETTQAVQPKTRRRDASVSAVSLASGLAKEAEITANARSNNLSKFLRSYASNLDNAISAERRVVMSTDAISVERRVVMTTDAEDDVEQPLLAKTDESATPSSEVVEDVDDSGIELELDLHTLQLESEYSNQVDSPPTAGSDGEEVSLLVEATDCEPLAFDDECDEGNNNCRSKRIEPSSRLSKAFTPADYTEDIASKQPAPESTRSSDSKPNTSLARFKQQIPSNGRRNIAALQL